MRVALSALAAAWLFGAAAPALGPEIARGAVAVGLTTSEEPAMRQARQAGEPSAGFQLGAALAAWANAAAQLDFDLKNPAAIGPPHAHLAQDGDDYLRQECREEAVAFDRLESRSKALSLAPAAVVGMAGSPPSGGSAEAWLERRKGPAAACR